eukprot:TRINITY_DN74409_c0_g1_i1.p4 TRINITY_DN74409_c0_g1~~TRINITY_DN74409_c0_g1_i1.p4  ORF type:complete len:143 (+),score=44.36 TRINITY_DN74409_c0_g1_i1:64-492(+)
MGNCCGNSKPPETKPPPPAAPVKYEAHKENKAEDNKSPEPPVAKKAMEPWVGSLDIRTLTSDVLVIENASSEWTVDELKARVAEKTGGDNTLIRFVAGGRELTKGGSTLREEEVTRSTLLVILFRLTEREREEIDAGHHGVV